MPVLQLPRSVPCAALLLILAPAAFAQGSPPMNTDDPGTPGKGGWEFNLALSQSRGGGSRDTSAPMFEVNYGVTDTVKLSYALDWLSSKPARGRSESGLSNSEIGAKWRFLDRGKEGAKASVAPALEFNNPGSNAERKGLAAEGGTFTLPFQFEQPLGPLALNLEVGRAFHFKAADEWSYGVAVGGEVSEAVALGMELFGDAQKNFHRSALLLNFGASIKVEKNHSLMLAVGRELHRHDGPKATFVGYLGWQIRR